MPVPLPATDRQKKYGQISRHGVCETAPGDILSAFGIEDLPHYIQSKILWSVAGNGTGILIHTNHP